MLSGFGLAPTTTRGDGGGSTSSVKTDQIKQLQCLINIIMQTPEATSRFQKDRELWAAALEWDRVLPGGLPVSGYYRTAWPTEADAIWMFNRAGLTEFASVVQITPQVVDEYLTSYIQGGLQFMQRSVAAGDWAANVAACDFPGRAAAQAAAAAAALQSAAMAAAAEAEVAAQAALRAAAEQRDADAAAAKKAAEQAAAEAMYLQQQAELEHERAAQLQQQQTATQPDQGRESPGMTVEPVPGPPPRSYFPDGSTTPMPEAILPTWGVQDERKRMIKVGVGVALGIGLLAFTVSRARR